LNRGDRREAVFLFYEVILSISANHPKRTSIVLPASVRQYVAAQIPKTLAGEAKTEPLRSF